MKNLLLLFFLLPVLLTGQSTSICQIQGSGSATPFDGQVVTTSGVVTSTFMDAGQVGGYFHRYDGFSSLSPKDATWPSKIFNLDANNLEGLKEKITIHQLAKSVAISEDSVIENILGKQGFLQTSSVEAMTMKATPTKQYATHKSIEKVTDIIGAKAFAKIASNAFGYTIYDSTISSLVHSPKIQLFLGVSQESYMSCGIVFQDSNGDLPLFQICFWFIRIIILRVLIHQTDLHLT